MDTQARILELHELEKSAQRQLARFDLETQRLGLTDPDAVAARAAERQKLREASAAIQRELAQIGGMAPGAKPPADHSQKKARYQAKREDRQKSAALTQMPAPVAKAGNHPPDDLRDRLKALQRQLTEFDLENRALAQTDQAAVAARAQRRRGLVLLIADCQREVYGQRKPEPAQRGPVAKPRTGRPQVASQQAQSGYASKARAVSGSRAGSGGQKKTGAKSPPGGAARGGAAPVETQITRVPVEQLRWDRDELIQKNRQAGADLRVLDADTRRMVEENRAAGPAGMSGLEFKTFHSQRQELRAPLVARIGRLSSAIAAIDSELARRERLRVSGGQQVDVAV